MVSFDHKNIIKSISQLNFPPSDSEEYSLWLTGEHEIAFLQQNAGHDELMMYAGADHFYLETAAIPITVIEKTDIEELLGWSGRVFDSCASYVTGGGREDAWIERDAGLTGSAVLEQARPLLFGRQFEGLSGPDALYFEVSQEYAHLNGIHWRPEHRAYCRFDENGDFFPVVSASTRKKNDDDISLVTFKRGPLDEYLAADRSALIRVFDFTCFRPGNFDRWPDGPDEIVRASETLAFRRKVGKGRESYIRGVQILKPNVTPEQLAKTVFGFSRDNDQKYVSFIAHDWRNNRLLEISTAPRETTNYFEAKGNDLPFELSPAFFRRDVLSKYRQDREKYGVGDRDITCRGAWYLKGFDINEAGQVHAYICDLRRLPYQEQLYWKSFNEPPKDTISNRAFTNDFKGEWSSESNPLQDILRLLDSWERSRTEWWRITDEKLTQHIAVPNTGSCDEWAESFMDLSKLVTEGFRIKFLRKWLDDHSLEYDEKEQSIALLERILASRTDGVESRLDGLRTVQLIRSKVKGHSGSSKASEIERDAVAEHETFAAHFEHVCAIVYDELQEIDRLLR